MVRDPTVLFWREIDKIQNRHLICFPKSQRKYFLNKEINSKFKLTFMNGYDLPSVITFEIQLAFKLILEISEPINKKFL